MTDPATTRPTASSRAGFPWFLGLSVILLLHIWLFRTYITDDAYISFRFLRNLIDGTGLLYNPPERVWGFTNFLWILCIAPFSAMLKNDLVAARIIASLASLLTLIACMIAARRIEPGRPAGALLCGALLALNGAFAMQSMSGLETSLFTMLLVSAVLLQATGATKARRFALPGSWLLLALATLTRPEGLFLGFILFAHLFLHRSESTRSVRTLVGQAFVFYCLPVLAAYLPLALYYGSWYPNPISAKVGLSFEQLIRGFHYAAVFLSRYPITGLLIAIGIWNYRSRGPLVRLIVSLAVFLVIFYAAAGGDWMPGYRLYHPVIALACILSPLGLSKVEQLLRRRTSAPTALLRSAIVLGILAVTMAPTFLDSHVARGRMRSYVHDGIAVGKWMKKSLPPSTLLATNTGGTIPYFSGLRTVDMMGLNDLTVSRRKDVPKEWKGIEKGDGAYVLSRRPDYIHLGSSRGSATPVFLSDTELYAREDFWQWYDMETHKVEGELDVILWKRRSERRTATASKGELDRRRLISRRAMEDSRFRY